MQSEKGYDSKLFTCDKKLKYYIIDHYNTCRTSKSFKVEENIRTL